MPATTAPFARKLMVGLHSLTSDWHHPLAYLAEFVELGEIGDRQKIDIDHAEELQIFKVRGKADDLPIVRAAVIQHQLLHLQEEGKILSSWHKEPSLSLTTAGVSQL